MRNNRPLATPTNKALSEARQCVKLTERTSDIGITIQLLKRAAQLYAEAGDVGSARVCEQGVKALEAKLQTEEKPA